MRKSRYFFLIVAVITALTLATGLTAGKKKGNSSMKAANALLEAMQVEQSYKETVVQMVDVQIQQAPQMAPYRKVILDFFEKYVGWDAIKYDVAKLYADNFTVKELKELRKFYLTPLGKKAAKLLPELTAQGAAIGQRKVQENMGELQRMLAEERQRLEAGPN